MYTQSSTHPLLPVLIMSRPCQASLHLPWIIFAVPLFRCLEKRSKEIPACSACSERSRAGQPAQLREGTEEFARSPLAPAGYRQLRWMLMRDLATRRGPRGWLAYSDEDPLPGRSYFKNLIRETLETIPAATSWTSPPNFTCAIACWSCPAVKTVHTRPERCGATCAQTSPVMNNGDHGRLPAGIDVFESLQPLVRESGIAPTARRISPADTHWTGDGSPPARCWLSACAPCGRGRALAQANYQTGV